jgi:translation initiation factor 5B
MLRQPILCVLGHVDHGKTTLLDKIRKTAVAQKEAGGITQAIGATEIPKEVIEKICGDLLEKYNVKLEIPGLLILDTPGHEAFTSLRRIGGSCADLAILVIDITQGIQEQTKESIEYLRLFKTPFVVAATKIDKIPGWISREKYFLDNLKLQPEFVKQKLEEYIYTLVAQLSELGFAAERFDRVADFKTTLAIVPCSGVTGEGIPELLVILAGLAQIFLKDKLTLKSENAIGSILEVKEARGFGTVIDVIFYDGEVHRGDWLIIGGKEPIVTKIKAILKPRPLGELRVEKQFENVESARAACGVRIAAPGLEDVKAGMPIVATRNEKEIETIKENLRKDVALVEFERTGEGIIAKADTLGSLDALLHVLKQKGIEVKKAEIGNVSRSDVMLVESQDKLKKVILAFNVGIDRIAEEEAKARKVKIFQNNVIYRLMEEFEEWIKAEKERERKEKLERITRPGKIRILPGYVFRISKPAIVGVEVLEGIIKPEVKLVKDGKEVGTIKEIQSEGETQERAEKGERVAVSIDGGVVGRNVKEGDELLVLITKKDLEALEELRDMVSEDEIKLAREILEKIDKKRSSV